MQRLFRSDLQQWAESGKLRWAARRWARGAQSAAPISEDVARALDDARRFGMDAASFSNLQAALSPPADPEEEGVWADNWGIVQAFLAVCLQWRVVNRGGGGFASLFGGQIAPLAPLFIGLDYAAVRAGLDAEGIEVTPELWRGLRVMEAEACSALNEDKS